MPISPARTAAYDVLLRVEGNRAYAPDLLHFPHFPALSLPDHALAIELVMGVLRWRSLLDENIRQYSSTKLAQTRHAEVLTSLRLGAYQLLFLDRVPRHAAVDESVKLVKRARKGSAVPLANAVLRRVSAGHSGSSYGNSRYGRRYCWRKRRGTGRDFCPPRRGWSSAGSNEFGMDRARLICSYDQQVPEVCLHAWGPGRQLGRCASGGGKRRPGGGLVAGFGSTAALGLIRRRRLALGNESYSVQDEASQLVALLVGRGADFLDGCAAPGGKTRIMARRNPRSRIVACELHPHRARLLRKLVPDENVRVIAADLRALPMTLEFDRVLADVPCSGTGTLARNPEIKWRLRPEDLRRSSSSPTRPCFRRPCGTRARGGRLVYATCSLEEDENSEVVDQALAGSSGFRLLDCRAELDRLRSDGRACAGFDSDLEGLVEGKYLRTLPGVHPCDGFFAAILARD
jgi:16S rRNA (cytosine967-C5)-methyltransferase